MDLWSLFKLLLCFLIYKVVIGVKNFFYVRELMRNPEEARKKNPKLGCTGKLDGPPQVPFFKNILNTDTGCMANSTVAWSLVYGRVIRVGIPKPFVSIGDPALLSKVHASSDWNHFDRGAVTQKIFEDIAGGLVMQPNGQKWQFFRQIIQQSFDKRKLSLSQVLIQKHIDQLCTQIQKHADAGKIFDFQEEVQKMTFDIIGRVAFGFDFGTQSQHQSQASDCFQTMLSILMKRFMSPIHWWHYITLPIDRKYNRARDVIHGLIRECYENYKKNGVPADDQCTLADLIRASEKEPISEREVIVHITTLLFAGHDTTMNAITWLVYYLTKHPEVLKKVRKEIQEKKGDCASDPNVESSYPYLKAVIKETLRLRGSAPLLGRMMNTDCEIEWTGPDGVTQNKHVLRKGDLVMIDHWTNQTHPQNGWIDPMTFNPARFDKEAKATYHPSAWIPFGAGPRICVGQKLALKEITMTAIALVQKFDFTLVSEPGYRQDATLRADPGLMLTATKK